MRLALQVLTKQLELYEEFILNKSYFKSIWYFYCAYNIALCITGIEDNKIRLKNQLWVRFISKFLEGKFDLKIYNKINSFIKKDIGVIIKALRIMEKDKNRFNYDFKFFDNPAYVGVLSEDYPE